jgi:hypothetical protein
MTMNVVRRFRALAVSGMLAVTTLGLPAAQAHAATGDSCKLTIRPLGSNQYQVTIGCTVKTTSAGGAIRQSGYTLYGEDTFFDDTLWYVPGGNSTSTSFVVLGNVLDEDWGTDEVYARAVFIEANGVKHNIRSNTVEGSF